MSSETKQRLTLDETIRRLQITPEVLKALLRSGLLGHWTEQDGIELAGVEHFESFGTQWRADLGEHGKEDGPFHRQFETPGATRDDPVGTYNVLQIAAQKIDPQETDTGWLAQFYIRPNPFFWPAPTAMAMIGPPAVRLRAPRSVPGTEFPTTLFPDPDGVFALLAVEAIADRSEFPLHRAEEVAYPVLDALALEYDQPLPVAQSIVVGIPSGVVTIAYPKISQPVSLRSARNLDPTTRHPELVDAVALYREGISSNNPFHQFLTLWRCYENACAVGGSWRKQHKRKVEMPLLERIPEGFAYQGFAGLSFDKAKQQLNDYRVAIAHGQTDDGHVLTWARSKDVYDVTVRVPVIRYVARVTIKNVAATLDLTSQQTLPT